MDLRGYAFCFMRTEFLILLILSPKSRLLPVFSVGKEIFF
jgi:hypothetical protein